MSVDHPGGRRVAGSVGGPPPALTPETDRPAHDLDDFTDREELRQRYKRLLEETRVLLPGLQVLVAFLLTVPFAAGFAELDDIGRAAYGVAIVAAILAVVVLVSPIAFHRIAERTARSARLVWGIRMALASLPLLAISLVAAIFCVARHVFGTGVGVVLAVALTSTVLVTWVALPIMYRRPARNDGVVPPIPERNSTGWAKPMRR